MAKEVENRTWIQVFLKWCNVYGITPKAIEVSHNTCTVLTCEKVEKRTLRRLEATINHPAATYQLQGLGCPGITLTSSVGAITATYHPENS